MSNFQADDIFREESGAKRVLRGVSIFSASTRITELAGRVGFETVWIDVEHGSAGYSEVESLCVAAEAAGVIPTVRIPNNNREHVLHGLEAGARILVVPMVNTADQANEVVLHGKFPPLGQRGYNTRSRAVNFGLEGPVKEFEKANRRTCLFAQIETMDAVKNLESICQVTALSGIFIGPGDLSQSMGKTGQFQDDKLIETVATCIQQAQNFGKYVGIFLSPGPMLDAVRKVGVDLIIAGGDISNLAVNWQNLLKSLEI